MSACVHRYVLEMPRAANDLTSGVCAKCGDVGAWSDVGAGQQVHTRKEDGAARPAADRPGQGHGGGAVRDVDRYLDRVQEAVEAHPTWDVDEILRHTFKLWVCLDAEAFVEDIKVSMERDYEAQTRMPS
jgi:hypothetical protein